jgi:hypothetical protein
MRPLMPLLIGLGRVSAGEFDRASELRHDYYFVCFASSRVLILCLGKCQQAEASAAAPTVYMRVLVGTGGEFGLP